MMPQSRRWHRSRGFASAVVVNKPGLVESKSWSHAQTASGRCCSRTNVTGRHRAYAPHATSGCSLNLRACSTYGVSSGQLRWPIDCLTNKPCSTVQGIRRSYRHVPSSQADARDSGGKAAPRKSLIKFTLFLAARLRRSLAHDHSIQ